MPEWCGGLADDDGEGPMGLVALSPDRDAQAFAPGPLGQLFDLLLAAVEGVLALFGLQQEALEVTEVIEDQPGDLAGVGDAHFTGWPGLQALASRRGQDGGWIAAEAGYSAGDLRQLAMEDRVPAVVVRNGLGDPAQHRQFP